MELELKKLLKQSKDESAEGKGRGEEKEHVVYVTPSRKLERFNRKPVQGTDPSVEQWIEYAKAIFESKGLKKEQTALFLLEHLAGEARREILFRYLPYSSEFLGMGIAYPSCNSSFSRTARKKGKI